MERGRGSKRGGERCTCGKEFSGGGSGERGRERRVEEKEERGERGRERRSLFLSLSLSLSLTEGRVELSGEREIERE